MDLLDVIKVADRTEEKRIELYAGDLTVMTPDEAVDILVVSAFPNDYAPISTTLIGALYRRGISVAELAEHKAFDLRQTCSCWLSDEIATPDPNIQFKRILCFEPHTRGTPPEVVGDIFRSLAPFLGGQPPVSTVAMPVVASGNMMVPVEQMLTPLLDAAVNWMALGLPLKCLKIVVYDWRQIDEAAEIFKRCKEQHSEIPPSEPEAVKPLFDYDVFISYAHKNSDEAALVINELQKERSDLRIFHDKKELNVGSAWQHEIFESLDACRKVLAIYSPAYVESKVCKEEFNIAWARSRDTDEKVLFPIYLYSAPLPTYMKLVQYVDCREGSWEMIVSACKQLLSEL